MAGPLCLFLGSRCTIWVRGEEFLPFPANNSQLQTNSNGTKHITQTRLVCKGLSFICWKWQSSFTPHSNLGKMVSVGGGHRLIAIMATCCCARGHLNTANIYPTFMQRLLDQKFEKMLGAFTHNFHHCWKWKKRWKLVGCMLEISTERQLQLGPPNTFWPIVRQVQNKRIGVCVTSDQSQARQYRLLTLRNVSTHIPKCLTFTNMQI